MSSPFVVRRPTPVDVAAMARLHVRSWQETYRGVMRDEELNDPEFVSRRERMWTTALTDPSYESVSVAVAERDDTLIGLASSGPAPDQYPEPALQLYTLYVLATDHGSGAGAALLAAVLGDSPAQLWVADPNPRAQAFYRKHGFDFDGTVRVDDGVRELRMTRAGRP